MDAELTRREAFDAMVLFVEQFRSRNLDIADPMGLLLADTSWETDILGQDVTLDAAVWSDWTTCVDDVLRQSRRT